MTGPTEPSRYLRSLAERVATACVTHAHARAILLTGSVGAGESDYHSDIDIITYYDVLPSPEQVRAVREQIGAEGVQERGRDEEAGRFVEEYDLGGVECEVGYTTVSACEQEIASVLERFDTESPAQKVIEGLLRGVPLHGAELIERWQARARAYPAGLARAMVEAHLRFYPIWRVQDWFAARDATIRFYQTLVESSYHILGILAGLNQLYFTPFYFKRLHQFADQMRIAPDNLAARLEGLFTAGYAPAVAELERLVGETVALVEAHMPEVDTSRVRRDLGARRQQWTPPPSGPSARSGPHRLTI